MTENFRCMKGPVGGAKKFAGEQHEAGLTSTDDLVGLRRCGNHADGAGRDLDLAVNGLGVADLIAGTHRNLLSRVISAS